MDKERVPVNTERPERGPVEELIAKRLRPLNKKVQRVRGYAAQDPSALNADQRSAVANLPVLEGSIRELEDLMRQVEEAELIAAARQRELREAAERDFESRVAERVAEAQLALAGRLGGFLSLHSLLRPATVAEQELTFAPLDLPPRMADAVLATDILRVARMYDDIIEGGEAAQNVLGGLATGPNEDDEEDARVHELLVLLAQPEVEVPETPMEPAEDPAVQVTLEAPVSMGRTTLNFLQEDELAIPDNAEADFVVVEPASVPGSVPVHEQTGFDWTAADGAEDDETAAARMQEAFSTGAAATPEINATADALEAVRLEGGGAETPASSTGERERKRAPRKRKPHSAKRENGSAAASGSEQQQQQQSKEGQAQRQGGQGGQGGQKKKENQNGGEGKPRQNRPRGPKKDPKDKDAPSAPSAPSGPDEDGFQVQKPKTRQAKPAGNAGGRGRGGRPAGSNGRQGGGNKENGSGAGSNKPRQQGKDADKEQQQPKPKPSIYKQTQPSGPSSAPIF